MLVKEIMCPAGSGRRGRYGGVVSKEGNIDLAQYLEVSTTTGDVEESIFCVGEAGVGAELVGSIDSCLDGFGGPVLLRTVFILDSSLLPALFAFSSRAAAGESSTREAISTRQSVDDVG